MRLLIECTHVYEHPELNSGIQRVVRNVVEELACMTNPVECVAVMMCDGRLYRVNSLAPMRAAPDAALKRRVMLSLDRACDQIIFLLVRVKRVAQLVRSPLKRKILALPAVLSTVMIKLLMRGRTWAGRLASVQLRSEPLTVRPRDHLVLLDSSWHADFLPMVGEIKAAGAGIVAVVYDLIPLTHALYCNDRHSAVFASWFDWVARTADGFMAISKTISDQVATEIERRLGAEEAARRWHGHFHLGSELDQARHGGRPSAEVRELFRSAAPTYLMVSTIEPRKNHAYLLDAFERLWAQGSPARLCIIGRIGWKCDDLIARIRRHPELSRRLFMINDANDASLEHAYSHARALVFPSHVEGFGLPLVEAMQRGLPAFASDIPVFREIGGDFISYFDLANPASLAERIAGFESSGQFPAARSLRDWHWIGWREASLQLVEGVRQGIERAHAAAALAAPADARRT